MKEFIYLGQPKKLSRIVGEQCPLISYNQFRKLLKDKDIRINNERISIDCIVDSGSEIKIYDKATSFKTVYSDDEVLIIYKPKGIASDGLNSVESIIRENNGNLILCHRLDTNTDGLLMFAKNERAFNEILNGFKNKHIAKFYRAKVYGVMQNDIVYKDYLVKNCDSGCVSIYHNKVPNGMEIVTECKVVGTDGNSTLLDIKIYSGKTHQIRAQLASHGHFILGDSKYGRDDINRKYGYKKQQLTACKLTFNFPLNSYLNYLNRITIEL